MKASNIVALAGSTIALAACSGVFQSHESVQSVYELRGAAVEPAAERVPATLVVARPRARPGLDTDRIAVTLPGRRLDAYAGGRWSASLPLLVEALLIESFRSSGGWQAVVPERSQFGGKYLLQTEIGEFEADYAGGRAAPTVRVRLRGELGLVGDRRLVAGAEGSATAVAAADRQGEVIAAFEAAYAAAAAQLVAAIDAAARAAEHAGEGTAKESAK
ncbi:MAG TPA: ABC-type transport auxiliary lipoprotein family protein [Steroidobacteraceae bacterium]|nr:ABC-type transport auxiliary lipoprotein family protein [Steroidobacteraceae bacterium]